jgi:hypothetical protein
MVDIYTKAVLTVIALALTLLAAENLMQRAAAQQSPCGSQSNPCHITNANIDYTYPLTVIVRTK